MLIRNATAADISAAVETANRQFARNLRIKDSEFRGMTRAGGEVWRVQLGVYSVVVRTPKPQTCNPPRRDVVARMVKAKLAGKEYRPRGSGFTVETAPGVKVAPPVSWRPNQKRISAACWHAYGAFIDALPRWFMSANGKSVPVIVQTGAGGAFNCGRGIRYQPGDGWEDFNVGSRMEPCMASEACECEEGDWERVVTESVAAFRMETS